jgi:hypothetical protein
MPIIEQQNFSNPNATKYNVTRKQLKDTKTKTQKKIFGKLELPPIFYSSLNIASHISSNALTITGW